MSTQKNSEETVEVQGPSISTIGSLHCVQIVAHCPEGDRAWIGTIRDSLPVCDRSKEKWKLQVASAGTRSKIEEWTKSTKPRLVGRRDLQASRTPAVPGGSGEFQPAEQKYRS